jgi:asparagine synthase (glutamine-hydrolysing)
MCGIAGYFGAFLPGLGEQMNRDQAHRGPNGSGVFENSEADAMLAHVRLAILDLSQSASQPMYSADGRFVLVYNGEIYNFRDLRHQLTTHNSELTTHNSFHSSGDTEVLLRGLERHGADFVPRLNGMFAFALWDQRERELLLARDPLGIKPLYYTEPAPGQLLFASEIKALCAHPGLDRQPDFFALQHHLAFCHSASERTALAGVRHLPPGCLLRWSERHPRPQITRYWQPAFSGQRSAASGQPSPNTTQPPDFSAAAEQLRAKIQEATARQLVSDVPVGAYFSGGLDSSLIVQAAIARERSRFRCFLISYPPEENRLDGFAEDAPFARSLARHLSLELEELVIKPEVASLWPKLIWHLDEPIADPAAIACYLISRQARQSGTPVLLSGQGGDELFGGYPRYWAIQAGRWFDRLPSLARRGLAGTASALLPGSAAGWLGPRLRRLRRMLVAAAEPEDERFLAYCASTADDDIGAVLSPAVRAALGQTGSLADCRDRMQRLGHSRLDRCLERDLSVYLPNHNLLYTDKMGMAVGLEARVPLLDQELVDLVTPWPSEWKVRGRQTKAVLREAARGILPDDIIHRPKGGFGAPYRKWLRHDLADMWNDLTAESVVRRRGWFDAAALRRARDRSQNGSADLYMLQWAVLTIELWAQQFIDRSPAGTSTKPAVSLEPKEAPTCSR